MDRNLKRMSALSIEEAPREKEGAAGAADAIETVGYIEKERSLSSRARDHYNLFDHI